MGRLRPGRALRWQALLNLPTVATSKRRAWISVVLFASAWPLTAQTLPEQIRPSVESARLGTGYAQMVNLSATPDLSAASYRIDSEGSSPTLDVLRVPYQSRWLALSPEADLYWKVAAGYLTFKEDFPFNSTPTLSGSVGSKWSAYSLSAGLLAKIRLGNGFTLEPALDIGVARLDNRASYDGAASALQPLLDGLVFNWNTNAWLTTPSLALAWTAGDAAGTATVRGHVARSWVSSFNPTDPVQEFNETANIYSLRAEYAMPSDLRAFSRPLGWVVYGGYAGFFGANRNALGFTSVAEVGGGLEFPVSPAREKPERVRLAAGYLFGSDVKGWTVGVSLQY